MSYRISAQPGRALALVVFEGPVSASEEAAAVRACAAHPEVGAGADLLVDRTRATMLVGPPDVKPHLDVVQRTFASDAKPKLALVVASDYDFGMARMLELTGGDNLPHRFRVFRSLDEACEWLGIAPADLVWP